MSNNTENFLLKATKPKSSPASATGAYAPPIVSGYQTIGQSPATTMMKKVINHQASEDRLRANKDTKIFFNTDNYGNKTITAKTRNSEYELSLMNYSNIFTKQDKSTIKILNVILAESNAQNDPEDIIIPIDMLVSLGIFGSVRSATRGLDTAMEKLTNLKISGKLRTNNIIEDNTLAVLFTCYRRVRGKGLAVITRNKKVRMEVLTEYITIFPKWAYPLSNKAFNLIDYIMTQARQVRSYKSISEKGSFNISFKAINDHLGQPTPTNAKNPSRDIKEAILEAITEMENHQTEDGDVELYFTPHYNEEDSIELFLNRGYLEVTFKGKAFDYFQERSTKRKEKTSKKNNKPS